MLRILFSLVAMLVLSCGPMVDQSFAEVTRSRQVTRSRPGIVFPQRVVVAQPQRVVVAHSQALVVPQRVIVAQPQAIVVQPQFYTAPVVVPQQLVIPQSLVVPQRIVVPGCSIH